MWLHPEAPQPHTHIPVLCQAGAMCTTFVCAAPPWVGWLLVGPQQALPLFFIAVWRPIARILQGGFRKARHQRPSAHRTSKPGYISTVLPDARTRTAPQHHIAKRRGKRRGTRSYRQCILRKALYHTGGKDIESLWLKNTNAHKGPTFRTPRVSTGTAQCLPAALRAARELDSTHWAVHSLRRRWLRSCCRPSAARG